MVVFTDRKVAVESGTTSGTTDHYVASISSARDYGVFGEYLTNRVFTPDAFPNSFNGKRDDEELNGWQNYGFRNYLKPTRRLMDRVDPLTKKYPWYSPYQFAGNTPIQAVDLDGAEPWFSNSTGEVLFGPYSNSYIKEMQLSAPSCQTIEITVVKAQQANFGYSTPPYTEGKDVFEYKLPKEGKQFTRVYTEGVTEAEGAWMLDKKDIDGLTPKEIQDKYSLPNRPTHRVDVDVPGETTVREGEAASGFGGKGGGTQYQLMEKIPSESFTNPIEMPNHVPIELGIKIEAPLYESTQTETPMFESTPTETPVFETPTMPIEEIVIP